MVVFWEFLGPGIGVKWVRPLQVASLCPLVQVSGKLHTSLDDPMLTHCDVIQEGFPIDQSFIIQTPSAHASPQGPGVLFSPNQQRHLIHLLCLPILKLCVADK